MVKEKVGTSWPQTPGQLVLEELLRQAGPTEDQKRTAAVTDAWERFVQQHVDQILDLRGGRFDDQASFFMDTDPELYLLLKRSEHAHLRQSAIDQAIENTLMGGGMSADDARVTRKQLLSEIARYCETVKFENKRSGTVDRRTGRKG